MILPDDILQKLALAALPELQAISADQIVGENEVVIPSVTETFCIESDGEQHCYRITVELIDDEEDESD